MTGRRRRRSRGRRRRSKLSRGEVVCDERVRRRRSVQTEVRSWRDCSLVEKDEEMGEKKEEWEYEGKEFEEDKLRGKEKTLKMFKIKTRRSLRG